MRDLPGGGPAEGRPCWRDLTGDLPGTCWGICWGSKGEPAEVTCLGNFLGEYDYNSWSFQLHRRIYFLNVANVYCRLKI
jgi:hypothetical protein